MVFLQKLFLTVVLIHVNSAINLNFFNFNLKADKKNNTKEVATTQLPKTVPYSTISTTTELMNDSVPFRISLFDGQKHEFENDTEAINASSENHTDMSSGPILGGQEIDESRNSSGYMVDFEKTNGILLPSSNLSSSLKISPLKLANLEKRKTVTITTTLVSKFTKYQTVYPSCVNVQNVKSQCDGTLVTIQPTPTRMYEVDQKTVNETYSDDHFDIIDPPGERKRRNFNSTINLENLKESNRSYAPSPLLEPSELDYEFEELRPSHDEKMQHRGTQLLPIKEKEPKYEIVTEYISIASTQTVTNYQATATVMAYNCLPKNINLKKCPSITTIKPIIRQQNTTKFDSEQGIDRNDEKTFTLKPTAIKPTTQDTDTLTTYNILDELHSYLIMNANKLFNEPVGGYETINLNKGSTIIESADGQFPIQFAKRNTEVKKKEH